MRLELHLEKMVRRQSISLVICLCPYMLFENQDNILFHFQLLLHIALCALFNVHWKFLLWIIGKCIEIYSIEFITKTIFNFLFQFSNCFWRATYANSGFDAAYSIKVGTGAKKEYESSEIDNRPYLFQLFQVLVLRLQTLFPIIHLLKMQLSPQQSQWFYVSLNRLIISLTGFNGELWASTHDRELTAG